MKMRWINYLAPLTLMEWALIFCYFYFSGRLRSYLIPNLQPLVVVAGILMLGLAIIMLLSISWDEEDEHDHHHDHDHGHDHPHEHDCGHDHSHDCGHDHGHQHEPHSDEPAIAACCGQPGHEGHVHGPTTSSGAIFRTLLLTVPLLVAAIISHDQFGQTLVRNRGAATLTYHPSQAQTDRLAQEAAAAALPKPENALPLPGETTPTPPANPSADQTQTFSDNGPLPAVVTDLIVASQKDFMRKVFEGKPVEMIGQVYEADPKLATPGTFGLVRFVMTCCAADAQPVVVPIHIDAKQGKFPDMTWVKVNGTVHYKQTDKGFEPAVDSATVTETPEPDDPYLD